jgi:hypothetical protein
LTSGFWAWPRGQRRDLRHFGWVMAAALAALSWYQGGHLWPAPLSLAAGLFLLSGLAVPAALRVPYGLWMYLARVLGWVNTRLLLGLVFYTLFTVIGVAMRLLGRDPLQRRWEPSRPSYWQPRHQTVAPRDHFKHQF